MEKDLRFVRLCQYMYKKGIPFVSDTDYDTMIKELQAKGMSVNLYWEDITEEEGLKLIQEFGISNGVETGEVQFAPEAYKKIIPAAEYLKEEFEVFKGDRNKSIPIVTDKGLLSQIYTLFKNSGVREILTSLKLDGWNITLYIKDGEIVYAHTRGRITEATDVTSIMKGILRDIDGKMNIKRGYVVGELYLNSSTLPYLRDKYGKDFKTTRNSVASFLYNKVTEEDLPLAQFGAFRLELEDTQFKTVEEMYLTLEENGFQIPIYEKIGCSLDEMVGLLINWSNQINHLPPSDGIVYQPNDFTIKNSLLQIPGISGGYETGIYAIKMAGWGEQVYKTIIKDITLTSNTKSKRPSLIVEPVTTRDGRSITTVPVDHVGRLIDENLYVGKEISLRIVSEKDIRLVYDETKASFRTML